MSIERRINVLESNQSHPPGCHVCREWPPVVVFHGGRAIEGGWPEPAGCPHCGRQPLRTIVLDRLTDAKIAELTAINTKATELGGLDKLTTEEVDRGAELTEKLDGIEPREPATWPDGWAP